MQNSRCNLGSVLSLFLSAFLQFDCELLGGINHVCHPLPTTVDGTSGPLTGIKFTPAARFHYEV